MSDTEQQDGGAPLDDRVDQIEQRQEEHKDILNKILARLSGSAPAAPRAATAVTEDRLSGPGDIAAEVQAELDRRDEKTKREQRDADFGSLKETVTKLTEKVPEQPIRKIEQIMGWH